MAQTPANGLCTIETKQTVNLLCNTCNRHTGYKATTLRTSRGPLCWGLVGHCTCGRLLNPPLGVLAVSSPSGSGRSQTIFNAFWATKMLLVGAIFSAHSREICFSLACLQATMQNHVT